MGRLRRAAQGGKLADAVVDPQRRRFPPREGVVLTAARRGWPWGESVFWLVAIALLSPLLIYYSAGVMPLPALFGIAGGIALGLALTARRLHRSLLDDALS